MGKSYQIKSFELGPMDNLIHLVWDKATKKAAVFDPAWDAEFLLNFVKKNELSLEKIIITHTHYDHINAVPDLLNVANLEIFIDEREYLNPQLAVFPDEVNFVKDGEIINLGDTNINCISTPGHSIGGVCYEFSHDVITGDTIFIYGCGHCVLPGSDVEKMFSSLQKLKNSIDSELIVHTSHTYGITNTSTWQQQLDGNPFLHFDDLDMFVEYREVIHNQMRTYPMAPMSKREVFQLFHN